MKLSDDLKFQARLERNKDQAYITIRLPIFSFNKLLYLIETAENLPLEK